MTRHDHEAKIRPSWGGTLSKGTKLPPLARSKEENSSGGGHNVSGYGLETRFLPSLLVRNGPLTGPRYPNGGWVAALRRRCGLL